MANKRDPVKRQKFLGKNGFGDSYETKTIEELQSTKIGLMLFIYGR